MIQMYRKIHEVNLLSLRHKESMQLPIPPVLPAHRPLMFLRPAVWSQVTGVCVEYIYSLEFQSSGTMGFPDFGL